MQLRHDSDSPAIPVVTELEDLTMSSVEGETKPTTAVATSSVVSSSEGSCRSSRAADRSEHNSIAATAAVSNIRLLSIVVFHLLS